MLTDAYSTARVGVHTRLGLESRLLRSVYPAALLPPPLPTSPPGHLSSVANMVALFGQGLMDFDPVAGASVEANNEAIHLFTGGAGRGLGGRGGGVGGGETGCCVLLHACMVVLYTLAQQPI